MNTLDMEANTSRSAYLDGVGGKFPAELIAREQWVVWRYKLRPGDDKPTKVPYDPKNRLKASTTDSATWGSFEQVCRAYLENEYDGLGYVFSQDDPYTGVDLDNCIVDGRIDPVKWGYACQLDSYTEYSPSGSGIHIIVRAVMPGEKGRKSNTDKVEMYDRKRFFTVTGEHFEDTPSTVEERQEALCRLCETIFGRTKRRRER